MFIIIILKHDVVVLWYSVVWIVFYLACLSSFVQDQGCLPGLVVFLDNRNPEVVATALEVKEQMIVAIFMINQLPLLVYFFLMLVDCFFFFFFFLAIRPSITWLRCPVTVD